MRTPTIHLNGDSQKNLLSEATDAMHAINDARAALCRITINGRNFYPQGPGALEDAADQFAALLQRFDAIREEVEQYAIAVSDGGHKRD